MSKLTKNVSVNITAENEKQLAEVEKCLQILAQNLNRNSLVILANKSGKAGINEKIMQYKNII